VTALEILHGVLLNPEMSGHAFFYFRDPGYAAADAGFTEEDPTRRKRLAALKDDIRKSGFPVAENFATPKQLGEWVLRDLTAVIETLYPESSIPNPLDRAAADHEAYAASRRRVYIGRPEYIERLDAHAAGDGPPLVVLGESGGGKSALLANWTHGWLERHPETPVIVHFIGAAPDSADWMAMLRRLLGEFQRQFGIQIEIPDQPDALRMAFANALHMVAAVRGRVVLVLDALTQIEDRDGAPDLVWLPPVIPANVRLIVSTLVGRPLDDLHKRAWPVLIVEPLKSGERETLIVDYLKQFAKELGEPHRQRIAVAPQSANGLYLTTLLNELRLFGSHEDLDQRIGWYLEAANPLELYGKVIRRWEQDYEERGPETEDLVGESFSRLWAARRGLSETELLESLGTEGSPLPRAAWSPLFLAAADALVNRGGLLTIAHDFLREAVREAYLPTLDHQQRAHRALAAYFHGQPPSPRQLDELPWQWQEAGDWRKLADLLGQPAFFDALWDRNRSELKSYWARVEGESTLRILDIYKTIIEQPLRNPTHAKRIGTLLHTTGKPQPALWVYRALVNHYREEGDLDSLQGTLGGEALILQACGDLSSAMDLHNEEECICRETGNINGLLKALNNKGYIHYLQGDRDEAIALYKQMESLSRQLGDTVVLSGALANRAMILFAQGNLDGAMVLYSETEHYSRESGDKDSLAVTLGNEAAILRARGNVDTAMALHKEEECLYRELGNKDGLQRTLGNQSLILSDRGDADSALALLKEQEGICREIGHKLGLSCALNNQAKILAMRGDLDGALALNKEQERLCRELGNKDGLQRALGNSALLLHIRGDQDGAMALYKEAEGLCRELGDVRGVSIFQGDQVLILKTRGDFKGAMAMLREHEREHREIGNLEGLALSLANQAMILRRIRGQAGEARRLASEALTIAQRLGNQQLVTQVQLIRDSISAVDASH
jgi:tetratricopeptide (TPR) repeat protein